MVALLGPAEIRSLASDLGIRPTKTLGQNFVHDANTVRRIVAVSGAGDEDVALEIGPGLGSLTLAILEAGARLVAVEIDPTLAERLPHTIAELAPAEAERFRLVTRDALRLRPEDVPEAPTVLVANLPYNVSVPVLLHCLELFPSLRTCLVMVQAEVAERLAAEPGSKVYGVPSVKAAFYGPVRRAGSVGRQVFWPVPNVESGLVRIDVTPAGQLRHDPLAETSWAPRDGALRSAVFTLVDAAFAQRRKTLRAALKDRLGAEPADKLIASVGLDPRRRGETLSVGEYVRLAVNAREHHILR